MPAVKTRISRLLLVLLPGTVFLALGLVGLWDAARRARDAVQVEAARGASAAARSIGLALRSSLLDQVIPEENRFSIVGGALVVPESLGWIDQNVARTLIEVVPAAARELVEQVALADAKTPEKKIAELFTAALGVPGLDEAGASWVRSASAWEAHRAGDHTMRDERLATWSKECPEDLPAVVVSVLLLHAAAGRDLPPWSAAAARRLPDPMAAGLLARIEDHAALQTAGISHLRAEVMRARDWRRRLQTVAAARELLASAKNSLIEALGAEILICHPRESGTFHGILIPPDDLARALRRAGPAAGLVIPWSGRLVFGRSPPPDARSAGPLIGVVPEVQGSVPIWTEGWVLSALLLILGTSFIAGLYLSVRTLRREAAAARTRADFLTSVTHELRTPLASIRLLAEMLEEGRVADDDKRREYHQLLSGEAGRLTMLIENVLDLGRMERGERSYDQHVHNMDAIVSEALELFAPVATREELALECELQGNEARGLVDRGAVVQALLNLMDNARKYGVEGGKIRVATERNGQGYIIRVRDFGPGVPAAERREIFDRFRRGSGQSNGRIPGVGLGLYLAREILRAQGGDLELTEANSEPGAEFVARIPLISEETP